MNLQRVQKNEKKDCLKKMKKIKQFNTKKGKQHFPRSHPQL